jgi:hypothetical protein
MGGLFRQFYSRIDLVRPGGASDKKEKEAFCF